ncbi:RTCB [Enterospora canceri]|uniref:3'-phosphate/5'-hydroxy nucleic acid ligase n=1 Tax=Enterospora canceri TaxID=1081671 RepID=A0A1Y1S743_9MICR|nr:RTCB [Enterospora canceri]
MKAFNDFILFRDRHRLYMPQQLQKQLLEDGVVEEQLNSIVESYKKVAPGADGLRIVGLPDMHPGYSFPIGTVVAMPLEGGFIAPEGVGYDINCGVRVLRTNLTYEQIASKLNSIISEMHEFIPSGTRRSSLRLSQAQMKAVLSRGIAGLVGTEMRTQDGRDSVTALHESVDAYEKVEDFGSLETGVDEFSQKQLGRGIAMFGTLGGGNHYLEIERVAEVYEEGSLCVGDVLVFIHCGSRSLGHEICRSHATGDLFIPIESDSGQAYFGQMKAAANYAYANREAISAMALRVLRNHIPEAEVEILSDCGHNIARIETVGGKEWLIHRKGASRAKPGDLVGVGGSMATSSYVLRGCDGAEATFHSTAHGSGRLVRRSEARRIFSVSSVLNSMAGIELRTGSIPGVVEEAASCYKDVNAVVDHCERVGISRKVAKTVPIAVIKG